MQLYNTRTRSAETLKPLDGKTVRIYSCGPTVYDHAHIGNLSAYIFADTLRRAVQLAGFDVKHAMNYTDVDDKTIRRSHEKYPDMEPREALHTLTNEYIDLFLDDMQRIGNDTAALTFLRATDEPVIQGMRELITKLHEQGFAYIADDGVYFSIEAYRKSGKTYGQLLELSSSNTSEARIQNDEYDKESVHDFALWKKQKDSEPAWEFTLDGQHLAGRPGWHIECSVMSRRALGQPFDIHTGGIDLIFPHHENEIAQSTAGEDDSLMAAFFTHNEHILVDGKKMSKSANNFYTLQDIIDKGFDPLAFRLLVLQANYRSQVHFSWDNLLAAQNSLKNMQNEFSWIYHSGIQRKAPTAGLKASFDKFKRELRTVLVEDLDTPQAIRLLHEYVSAFQGVPASQLDIPAVEDFANFIEDIFGFHILVKDGLTPHQGALITEREEARKAGDWAKSDELRDQLTAQKIGVRDTTDGTIWFRL